MGPIVPKHDWGFFFLFSFFFLMRQSLGFPVAAAIKTAIKAVITPIKSQPLLLLLVLFAMAFILRAIFPDTSYFFWDEAVYLLHGRLFAGQEAGYSETFLRPPLLPLILSPFAGLASYELVSRLLVSLLNSFIIFPVYYFTKLFFNKKAAVVAAITVAVLPVYIINSRWVMTDALGALLAFSSVAAYLAGFKTGKKLLLYAGGILTGLAVLMKFTNLLLLALLLPLLLANLRKRLSEIAASMGLAAAVVVPYLISSALSFGSPFYTFGRAFHVVAEQDPINLSFFLYLLKDTFGIPLLAFLVLGIALSISLQVKRISQRKLLGFQQWKESYQHYLPYLLYCLFATLAYSLFIVGRGVSKPSGLEWEAERFMLLFILFAIPFISCGIVWLLEIFRRKNLHLALVFVIAAVILSLSPQLLRAYAPAIAHEDGLRQATRDMGFYLRGSAVNEFSCSGNCPPLAYYSEKRMGVYFSVADLAAANHSSLVVFDGSREELPGYAVAKEFCNGGHCAYLLSRR